MKGIVTLLIAAFLPSCFAPSGPPQIIRGDDFRDVSILSRRDDCKVVSNAYWHGGVCGLKNTWPDIFPITRGALMATDTQLTFLIWNGEEYEPLLELDYDRIIKSEIRRYGDSPRGLMNMVVFGEKGRCYTFTLTRGQSSWLFGDRIDEQKTLEMADLISVKIEMENH